MPNRRRRANAGGKTNLPPRNLQMVERTLENMRLPPWVSRASGVYSSYLKCRLDPFTTTAEGAGGIPDAAMVSRVVVDHRDFATLTVGTSGAFQVRLMPNIPIPLSMKPTTGFAAFLVNGVSIAAATVPVTSAASGYGWVPMVTLNEWQSWMTSATGIITELPGPYSAVKARIVSFGLKVFYTGAASTASGTVTVTADRSVASGLSNVGQAGIIQWFSNGAGSGAVTTFMGRLDFGSITQTLDANSVTERSEVPLRITPRRLDETRPWLDVYQNPVMFTDSTLGVAASNGVFTTDPVTSNGSYSALYDDGWEQAVLTFSGVASGSTFRFETAVCVEYQPIYTSSVAKLSKKPDKVVSVDTLSRTEAQLSKQPIAANQNVQAPVAEITKAVASSTNTVPPPLPPVSKSAYEKFEQMMNTVNPGALKRSVKPARSQTVPVRRPFAGVSKVRPRRN